VQSDEATVQQDEAQESADVSAGNYSAASNDATQAYQDSETVAGEGGADNTDETWTAQLNESWANSDQQTADQDAQTADSYAAAGFTDDAQMYSGDAQGEEANADSAAEEGQYGDPIGPEADASAGEAPAEDASADEAPVDEAPVDDAPVDDAAADDAAGADDSSS
jgi:hypothetical protein